MPHILLTADIFWTLSSEATQTFTCAILPSFETSLKPVVVNPLNSTAGFLEGYIALSCLILFHVRENLVWHYPVQISQLAWLLCLADSFIAGNTTIQSLAYISPKLALWFWDKIYQKLTNMDNEMWLLWASSAASSYLAAKNEQLWQVFWPLQINSIHLQYYFTQCSDGAGFPLFAKLLIVSHLGFNELS